MDGEGSVSIDEFIKGTIRAQGQPTSLDVFIVKGNLLKVHGERRIWPDYPKHEATVEQKIVQHLA